MCSGQICAALVWWQHPAAPGERGHTSPAQWVRGGRAVGKYPGIASLYLTQLWSMNDHYDVMTLKIEQSGNMRTEYLYEFVMVKNPLSLLFIIGVCKPIYFISLNLRHHQDCLNISTLSLSDNICPCYKQLNVKGIHSFLTKKILSDQDPKPVGDNNPDIELGERRSNLWQSANGLYWSVYFVSMSDWFASIRQTARSSLSAFCMYNTWL